MSTLPLPNDKDFQVLELIGAGSYGLVFAARRSSHYIAVKLIISSSNSTKNLQDLKEVQREIGTMANNRHENVVKLLSYEIIESKQLAQSIVQEYVDVSGGRRILQDHTDELHAIILMRIGRHFPLLRIEMELCGPTLRKWLDDDTTEGLSSQDVIIRSEIAKGLISGLKYLHDQHKIHRDLKPANIYFSNRSNNSSHPLVISEYNLPVKIGDFGEAREVTDGVSAHHSVDVGTRLYRAPEVDIPDEKYGKRADLYSLGLILYELFQRIPPRKLKRSFDLLTIDGVSEMVDNKDFPLLKEAIIGLTKRKRNDRTSSLDGLGAIFTQRNWP